MSKLREQIAKLEHGQWIHWTKYFLENLTPENIEKWKQQIVTPYIELSESEKNADRRWADITLSAPSGLIAKDKDGNVRKLSIEETLEYAKIVSTYEHSLKFLPSGERIEVEGE